MKEKQTKYKSISTQGRYEVEIWEGRIERNQWMHEEVNLWSTLKKPQRECNVKKSKESGT